jgi:hypothetical protein
VPFVEPPATARPAAIASRSANAPRRLRVVASGTKSMTWCHGFRDDPEALSSAFRRRLTAPVASSPCSWGEIAI